MSWPGTDFLSSFPLSGSNGKIVLVYEIHRASYVDIYTMNGDVSDGPLEYQWVVPSLTRRPWVSP